MIEPGKLLFKWRQSMDPDQQDQLADAIEDAFSPKEPIAIGTAVSMAATGTLSFLSFYGSIDNEAIGVATAVVTAWLPVIGVLLRSQYTPLANR